MKDWQQQLEQIEANWGRFEPVMTQPAGQGATVEYRFRNGTAVELEAYEIKIPKLLEDVKAYIKGRPQQMDWQKMNIGDLGYRLVTENQKQYLGEKVASWRMEIKPRPQHFDKRVTVATPLQKAGAYLLKAHMVGGNTSYIVLWLNDTSIAKKPLDQKAWYFVADAVTGAPGAQGQRRVLRLAATLAAAQPHRDPGQGFRRVHRRRGPTRHGPGHAAERLPVADHRHDAASEAAWPTWASPASGTRSATTPPTTRPRSTRSPTGPSIAPTSR